MRPYNTQCAPGAPAVLRGLRFAHIVIYTPNVTLGAHDLPTEDSRAPRSTLGAHDGHMADKGAHFFKSGAHERHLEDSLNERVRSAVYGVLLTFSYKRSSKNLPTYLPMIHIKVRPEDGPPDEKRRTLETSKNPTPHPHLEGNLQKRCFSIKMLPYPYRTGFRGARPTYRG